MGYETDTLIAEYVMGWKLVSPKQFKGHKEDVFTVSDYDHGELTVHALSYGMGDSYAFRPSTDMTGAWMVVKAICAKGFHWVIKTPFESGEPYFAGFTPLGTTGFNGRPDYEGSGETAMDAICQAAGMYVESNLR